MPRPKSILWVDDEVESLTSHILFLEEQGFAVETTPHGDDALVLLQRQPGKREHDVRRDIALHPQELTHDDQTRSTSRSLLLGLGGRPFGPELGQRGLDLLRAEARVADGWGLKA